MVAYSDMISNLVHRGIGRRPAFLITNLRPASNRVWPGFESGGCFWFRCEGNLSSEHGPAALPLQTQHPSRLDSLSSIWHVL